MESLLCPELAELIEKKINYRNKYTEQPNFNKKTLEYYDHEIDLLEKIETYVLTVKHKAREVINKNLNAAFEAGRKDGLLREVSGRSHSLYYYINSPTL